MSRVLFCGGSPTAHTWAIRGRQIASQRESWRAVTDPDAETITAADAVVVVKRFSAALAEKLHASGKPIIWDPIDFWQQPQDGERVQTVQQARALIQPFLDMLQPRAIIAANRQMAADLSGLAETVTHIYHHGRPVMAPLAVRRQLIYDGCPRFLGEWRIEAGYYAERYGWKFIEQPDCSGADAVFAARGGADGCWLARRWKSNVKAAHAILLGVPFIAWPESAYVETVPDGMGLWFKSAVGLQNQIERLNDRETHQMAYRAAASVRHLYTLPFIATQYEALIACVV